MIDLKTKEYSYTSTNDRNGYEICWNDGRNINTIIVDNWAGNTLRSVFKDAGYEEIRN